MMAPGDDALARQNGFKDYAQMVAFYRAREAQKRLGNAIVIPGATPPEELARQRQRQPSANAATDWMSALARIGQALGR
jgi:hypothetical protein